MLSPYLKPLSGFSERAYKPCFINTAHEAYLIPQWSYACKFHSQPHSPHWPCQLYVPNNENYEMVWPKKNLL